MNIPKEIPGAIKDMRGFDGFHAMFRAVYDRNDLAVLNFFLPAAQKVAYLVPAAQKVAGLAPDSQKVAGLALDNVKGASRGFSFATILENFTLAVDSVVRPVPLKIRAQKGRTDLGLAQTIAAGKFLAKRLAPSLGLKLNEMVRGGRITANAPDADKVKMAETEVRLAKLQTQLDEVKLALHKTDIAMCADGSCSAGKVDLLKQAIAILESSMELRRVKIHFLNNEAERLRDTPQTSRYRGHNDSINIRQEYTQEDSLVLMHELTHSMVCAGERLPEVAAITVELLADKYREVRGLGTLNRAVERFKRMTRQHVYVTACAELFRSYELRGRLSIENMNLFISQVDEKATQWADEDFDASNVHQLNAILKITNYFAGTASALVLCERVKTEKDLENVFDILNRTDLTDIQKLWALGITGQAMLDAIDQFVKKNKAKLVA